MKKQLKITNKMQEVAADILKELEVYMMVNKDCPKEIVDIFIKMFKKYELCQDPFTRMVCTTKEWAKNCLEYDKQLMMSRYGHYDGLD
jgi:hypothetical protein